MTTLHSRMFVYNQQDSCGTCIYKYYILLHLFLHKHCHFKFLFWFAGNIGKNKHRKELLRLGIVATPYSSLFDQVARVPNGSTISNRRSHLFQVWGYLCGNDLLGSDNSAANVTIIGTAATNSLIGVTYEVVL